MWEPQPKQREALQRTEKEILYGGSRGSGKSEAGLAWLLYDIKNPLYRALVIRRNSIDLKDWEERAKRMYLPTRADFVGSPATIKFPSGTIFRTGHLKDENAYSRYQGHQYQKMVIEELTQIARESDYEKLLGSLRSTEKDIYPQVFATTNPDGAGHDWVKERWNIPDEPTEIVITKTDTGDRVFIPATVEDNPKLMESDPSYVAYLDSIQDKDLMRAWRFGSWAGLQVEGAYYRDNMNQAKAEGRILFIPIEKHLPVHTYWDLGMRDSMAILFVQYVRNEIRIVDSMEFEGVGLIECIQELRKKEYNYGEHWFPHDVMVRELTSGVSRFETLNNLGVNPLVTPNIPVADGINAVRMMFNRLFIGENNKDFIRAISNYRKDFDEKLGVYRKEPRHDWASHYADALRYLAVAPYVGNGGYKTSY